MEVGIQVVEEVTVGSQMGLHARPAAQIAKMASGYDASLVLCKDGAPESRADCRSVLELLILAAGLHSRLRLVAEGPDAEKAAAEIAAFFKNNFGE